MPRQAAPSSIDSLESRAQSRGQMRQRAGAEVPIDTKPPRRYPPPGQSDKNRSPLGLPLANATMRVRRWFDLVTTGGYKSKCTELVKRCNGIQLALANSKEESRVRLQILRDKLHKTKKANKNLKAQSQKIKAQSQKIKAINETFKSEIMDLRQNIKNLRHERRTTQEEKRILLEALAEMPDSATHADLVEALASQGALTPADLHGYLKRAFYARRLKMISFLLSGQALAAQDLRLYHSVRLAHDRGEACVSARELHQAYQDLPEESFLRPDFFNLTVEQAIRDDDGETILRLISGHTEDYLQRISQNCFLGVCRVLARAHRYDECRSLLRIYLKSMPRNHRLYFLEPARALFDVAQDDLRDLIQPRGWRAILNEVDQNYDAVDEDDRRTFNRIVTQQLRKIPEGMADYMDIRFDPAGRARLLGHLGDALERRRPLSFVRICDGEGYAYDAPGIPGVPSEKFEADKLFLERYWWGATLDQQRRADIAERVRTAAARATVLGTPSVYRIIRDLGQPNRRFGTISSQRRLSMVLNALGNAIPINGRIFTEERSHHLLFDRGSLTDLASRALRVVIVGCWSPDQLALHTSVETEYVLVSPHMKVAEVARHREAGVPLHLAYPEISRRIESLSGPGVLVLVSAGIIGKIFVEAARSSGAVAVDIGSVSDYLAGYKTRPVADLLQLDNGI